MSPDSTGNPNSTGSTDSTGSSGHPEGQLYRLATIGGPRGLRGLVRLAVHTDDPQTRLAPGTVVVTEPADAGPLTITSLAEHDNRWSVSFEGYPDRTSVEALSGVRLLAAGISEPDAWYPSELAGLRAERPTGEVIGKVVGLEHYPAQDMLVVAETGGARTLIPFVTQIVPTVDVAAGLVIIDAPTGLLAADILEEDEE